MIKVTVEAGDNGALVKFEGGNGEPVERVVPPNENERFVVSDDLGIFVREPEKEAPAQLEDSGGGGSDDPDPHNTGGG